MARSQLICQGAEGRLFASSFFGTPCVVKERFQKRYRHPSLDQELTQGRMTAECRAMARVRRAGIDCPVVYFFDSANRKLYMEHVQGITLKQLLDALSAEKDAGGQEANPGVPTSGVSVPSSFSKEDISNLFGVSVETLLGQAADIARDGRIRAGSVAAALGKAIAELHNLSLIHGDLTSSNLMLRKTSGSPPFGIVRPPLCPKTEVSLCRSCWTSGSALIPRWPRIKPSTYM